LIDFVEEIARFWATGDRAPLAAFVPESVFNELDVNDPASQGVHTAFEELVRQTGTVEGVFALELEDLRERLDRIPKTSPVDRERAELLVRIWREIRRKYTLDHTDVMQRIRDFHRIDQTLVNALEHTLADGDDDGALGHALSVLERLQAMVLRPGNTQAYEDIYFKRHIAVGIPSMYGTYREERLDAMGLTFRLESLTSALMSRVMVEEALPLGRVARLRMTAGWLTQLHRGLRIDGFRAQGIAHGLATLDEALTRPATTNAQFLNIFQLLSRNLESSIRSRVLDAYEEPLRRVIGRLVERNVLPGPPGDETVFRHSEAFIRDLIATSLGLQRFDAIVGRTIYELRENTPRLSPRAVPPLDVARCVVPLATAPAEFGIVALGKKAFMLRRLSQAGMRVPEGFVLTTDVFLARDALKASAHLKRHVQDRVREELSRLEDRVGARLGDRDRPLLLSVRGGAPFSMPGMLATYLNVGMSPAVIEGVVARRGSWTGWDAYRRFVQSWGMGHGMDRDRFDRLIAEAKHRSGVARKALLPASDMRDLAHAYRTMVMGAGILIEDDPFAQLLACIELVQASWNASSARLYRRELQYADEWGTAVIVQAMVLGNLGPRSGSGVLLTSDPRRTSDSLELSGDFTVQGQGDDVVGGLVTTFPITERQRLREDRDIDVSMEKDFPAIHDALADVAHALIETHGMNHQEIEFTFEGDRAQDLYLLQTRDTVASPRVVIAAFTPSDVLDRARLAAGIGVSGGALTGRVAHTSSDIARLRARDPSGAVILLRPDTAPDDIALVLACDGLLTALGGATSHAAVTAKRLGKTCVVGCRALDVDERHATSRLGSRLVRSGDVLSISGLDGSVYLGAHPTQMVGVHGRAQS
jgi:pyruvate,orthophosphate dikinase